MPLSFTWPDERPHFAVVTRVVDGDTIHCDIDLDLRVGHTDYPVRLAGCNAWEVSTDAGRAARDNLIARLPVGTPVVLTLIKDYKYGGEFVAKVWLFEDDSTGLGVDLVAELVEQQWLAAWNGRGAAPVPPWPRTV